jgi:4-alpha-glucanotransferase
MTKLDELAARNGIEAEYRDAHGRMRQTAPETQRALLAAMGVNAADEAKADAALRAMDEAAWRENLAPVCVAYAGQPICVALVLPAGTRDVAWRVALEDGGTAQGGVRFDKLELGGHGERDGGPVERRILVLEQAFACGYHRLTVTPGDAEMQLIVSPGRCWLPHAVTAGQRLWGIAAQLYLLRSENNWGIGDYGDLRRLVTMMAARGADVVGLNPLHAMFLDDPEHASPYSPASRLLLNVLNIDVSALPEFAACEAAREFFESAEFQAGLAAGRHAALVDYAGVAELKLQILVVLFRHAISMQYGSRWQAFESFKRERGETLRRTCLFGAMRAHFAAQGEDLADWHHWPAEYRDPESEAVAEFAAAHAERVTFRMWLQFLADGQLAEAAEAADRMQVGLYRDLAVGAAMAGAETWANQAAVVDGAQVGAPPDIYNTAGQDWALPPFHPRALRQEAYRSFIELVRANMRHAGALRIDHVMALQHLYWVPRGKSPAEGAYVRYELDDLVGILALESHRNPCAVIGEDLGTVPEGFRERMAQAAVLSYRVLFFEKDADGFLPPAAYPRLALAVTGSHDLPTLRAWWDGSDLALKERLGLFADAEQAHAARRERDSDRAQLIAALRREGLAGDAETIDAARLTRVAHAYLARSAASLAMVQIDDITGEADPVNVPTTSDEHPNWRRRLSVTLEEMEALPRFSEITEIFQRERNK